MEFQAAALWMLRLDCEDTAESAVAALVKRAIEGDTSAFDQLVVRYERRVLTLAWRLLGTPEDAQDASQEVFLKAFRFLHRFDIRRPFEPWLVRMTVNVCRDFGRKRRLGATLDEEALISASDPHADIRSAQERQIVHQALQQLHGKERAAVVLRDIEGLSTAEVAEILGSSEGTVRSQICSAGLKMKKTIEKRMRGRS